MPKLARLSGIVPERELADLLALFKTDPGNKHLMCRWANKFPTEGSRAEFYVKGGAYRIGTLVVDFTDEGFIRALRVTVYNSTYELRVGSLSGYELTAEASDSIHAMAPALYEMAQAKFTQ